MELTSRIRLMSRNSGLHARDGRREVPGREQGQHGQHNRRRADLVPYTLDQPYRLGVKVEGAHAIITFFGWYSAWK